jgi:hypothetical protein
MIGWVDDFLDYAEIAVSRVTSVTTSRTLTNTGTQSVERAVTSDCSLPTTGIDSAKVVTKETPKSRAGLPPNANEINTVTKVTREPSNSGSYEQEYRIDQREAILKFCAYLPRDEAAF